MDSKACCECSILFSPSRSDHTFCKVCNQKKLQTIRLVHFRKVIKQCIDCNKTFCPKRRVYKRCCDCQTKLCEESRHNTLVQSQLLEQCIQLSENPVVLHKLDFWFIEAQKIMRYN